MNGPTHYREAERLLKCSEPEALRDAIAKSALADKMTAEVFQATRNALFAEAQVHATPELAAAVVDQTASRGPGDVGEDWKPVAL